MMSLNERLDLIEQKILEKSFRAGRGTANEVNFWIFDYDPEDEMAVRAHVGFLANRVNGRHGDARVLCFDLYGLMLEALREKNYLDRVLQMEQAKGSGAVANPIKRTLRLTEDGDRIIGKIVEGLTPEKDIIFLTGVGKAWPIVRSHTILIPEVENPCSFLLVFSPPCFVAKTCMAAKFLRNKTANLSDLGYNNLHGKVDKNPLVMFFPGDYTNELRLFGEITDDNYYRAFKLIER